VTYSRKSEDTSTRKSATHTEGSPEPSKTKQIPANQHKTRISEKYGARRVANRKPALLDAALWYAARGIPVLPLHSLDEHGVCTCGGKEVNPKCKPGKHPRTPHGHLDASTNPSRITAWWNRWPNANIGIPTGERSGWLVLDEDQPASLDALEAKHSKLPQTRTHSTGSGGTHRIFRYPSEAGSGIRNSVGLIGCGLDIRGEGGYFIAPPSATTGPYTVLENVPLADAPAWLVKAASGAHSTRSGEVSGRADRGAVSIDTSGPPIPDGERNDILTHICGRLHDGTRDLGELTRDLEAVNEARCTPPLDAGEVRGIAVSIYGRTPCKPAITARVMATVGYLREAAAGRPVRGMAGATGWSIYLAGLDALAEHGREHPQGATLSLDVRTWAQRAGTSRATVSRHIRRSPLMRVIRRGSGRRSAVVLFVAPSEAIGHYLRHSSSRGGSQENSATASVSPSALSETLARLRWGPGRIGKSRAAIMHTLAECGEVGELSRAEIAARLGRKPASMRAPLRWLVEAGLLERTRHGHYALPADFARRVEDARELGREPEADRLQIARHNRERDGYRNRLGKKPQRAPTEREIRQRRETYPERRRIATERAIAALFRERPEYRARRVGQITARLVHYIGPDFPRGQDGAPKDSEVEAILDGHAARVLAH
jgi:hypothetical protein